MDNVLSSKILEQEDLFKIAKKLRTQGKTIVFTNGCFDIFHAGHLNYLLNAKSQGDVLLVGLNSDISVKLIKDDKRPIINQEQRAYVLSGIECIDYITIFNEKDPYNLIKKIQPDILVKGEDWNEDEIIGASFVKNKGGKIVRAKINQNISTSMIIQDILEKYK